MTHEMKLVPSAFSSISLGTKVYELRLYDEKRRRIRIGDTVIFRCTETNDRITATVRALHTFESFVELYRALPLDRCGYSKDELTTASPTDMERFYTRSQIERYGVVALELCNVSTELESVAMYYDLLADEGNDPVNDPEPLRSYMDRWDGDEFIALTELRPTDNVLELGVGTGRLALRIAPRCAHFVGIDISKKSIELARRHLADLDNVSLHEADIADFKYSTKFDVIYSSLVFMHIEKKREVIERIPSMLKPGGRFVLSIDKSSDRYIDLGTRRIAIYPDDPLLTEEYLRSSGLTLTHHLSTPFAHIFSCLRSETANIVGGGLRPQTVIGVREAGI